MKLRGNRTIILCSVSLLRFPGAKFEGDVNSALYEVETKAIGSGDNFLISYQSEKCPLHGKKTFIIWVILLPYIYENIPTYLMY